MKVTDETITVVNKTWDEEKGLDVYVGTIIRGVSWFGRNETSVDDKGLHSADVYTIRIPEDADCSGKTYVDPLTYRESDPAAVFTIANGDTIVHGAVDTIITSPADLHQEYPETVTVLGVTDNRRAPRGKHFKVVCG